MNDVIKKGWCPTLTRPMETGDGLLVRLHFRHGILSAINAMFIAQCARRFGNGYIDLTSRGNLQIRGVSHEGYDALVAELTGFGLNDEPRPSRPDHADYLPPLGFLPTGSGKGTLGFGLEFGRLEVSTLVWLANAATHGNGKIFLTPWRSVFLPDIDAKDAIDLTASAAMEGLITKTNDALRVIVTCPGAPACSSALGHTRVLALEIASRMDSLVGSKKTVHVSGCAKGCAHPHKSSVVITARRGYYDLAFDAVAGEAPAHSALSAEDVLRKVTHEATV